MSLCRRSRLSFLRFPGAGSCLVLVEGHCDTPTQKPCQEGSLRDSQPQGASLSPRPWLSQRKEERRTLSSHLSRFEYSSAQQQQCWRRRWRPTPVLVPAKSMDGGAWWAAVHGVSKSRTRLSDFTFTFHFPALEKEMATHSSVLAWRIPGTGEPGGLLAMGSHRVGHD